MHCAICGSKIETTGFITQELNGIVLNFHAWCDPNVAVAKTAKIVAKPLNIKKYIKSAPSGTSYSGELIQDNIVGEI